MNKIGNAELKRLKEKYQDNLDIALKKIEEGYPIQYLIGDVDFYNINLLINENGLIPRYETELLVEKSIKFIKEKEYSNIIDLGTGSGAIAISLQKNLDIAVDACDISNEALEVAIKNNNRNNTKVNFFQMDILSEIPKKKYDCIISNPPYVKKDEYTSPETKYEPQLALYANHDGLEFYERILSSAKNYLNKNGSIIFEIGATQKKDIEKIALENFPKATITTYQDYNHFDRIMIIETNM